MIECQVTVRENRHLGDGFFLLNLAAPEVAGQAQPGQFVMLAAGGGQDPLLKRPFGILDAQGDALSLLYEVVGRGTQLLSEVAPGRCLGMVGPLGNGFPMTTEKRILMLAGGRGFAPLFLAARLMAAHNEVFFRYGARSAAQLKLADWLEEIPLSEVTLFTEDGSAGNRGRVGDGLLEALTRNRIDLTLSCGPDAMLKALAGVLRGADGLHYGSFEALMGCGIGICHSCVLAMKDGSYKKVCADGPVFPMEAVAWVD
jgi:dihydroorotate dehydrogenase electron transfer subunit